MHIHSRAHNVSCTNSCKPLASDAFYFLFPETNMHLLLSQRLNADTFQNLCTYQAEFNFNFLFYKIKETRSRSRNI